MPTVSLYNNNDDHHQIQKFNDTYLNYRKLEYEIQPGGLDTLEPTVLNQVQQGYEFFNRTGRRIIMKSLYITARFNLSYPCIQPYLVALPNYLGNGEIQTIRIENQSEFPHTFPNALTSFICELHDYVRILIVYDLQPNGKLPLLNELLYVYSTNDGQIGYAPSGFTSFMNLNNRDRFIVVLDERIALNTFSSTSGPIYTKFKELATETIYGQGNAINTGALYLWMFCTNGYTNGTIRIRVRFIDA
jgi:hypothetical protein